jgi:hypothetical protein
MSASPLRLGKDDHRLRARQMVVKLLRLALEEQVALGVADERRREIAAATPSLMLKANEGLR